MMMMKLLNLLDAQGGNKMVSLMLTKEKIAGSIYFFPASKASALKKGSKCKEKQDMAIENQHFLYDILIGTSIMSE